MFDVYMQFFELNKVESVTNYFIRLMNKAKSVTNYFIRLKKTIVELALLLPFRFDV